MSKSQDISHKNENIFADDDIKNDMDKKSPLTSTKEFCKPEPNLLREASLKFLLWAKENSLLAHDAYYPGEHYESPLLENSTAAGIAMLRSKKIKSVGINASEGCIYVLLQKAAPGARQINALPNTCEGFALRYFQGHTDAITPSNTAQASSPCAVHVSNNNYFYTCGSSISVGNARSAGTLGCLVQDASNEIYGLSNNHISGGCNYAPLGLPILAPGVIDVSPHSPFPFTLGQHSRQLPMMIGDPSSVNTILNQDAALFKIINNSISSMQQCFYDTPSKTLPLEAGMRVKKVGRSSGLTEGNVSASLTGPVGIRYSAQEYAFNGDVYFDNMFLIAGFDDRFSEPGDSGSLVVHESDDGELFAVGIIVGGNTSNSLPGGMGSLVMPIEPILTLLGVKLVSKHNI